MVVVPPEVVELCGSNPRATFFLCHRLRRSWGRGRLRQTDLLEVALRPREEVVRSYKETEDTTDCTVQVGERLSSAASRSCLDSCFITLLCPFFMFYSILATITMRLLDVD